MSKQSTIKQLKYICHDYETKSVTVLTTDHFLSDQNEVALCHSSRQADYFEEQKDENMIRLAKASYVTCHVDAFSERDYETVDVYVVDESFDLNFTHSLY